MVRSMTADDNGLQVTLPRPMLPDPDFDDQI